MWRSQDVDYLSVLLKIILESSLILSNLYKFTSTSVAQAIYYGLGCILSPLLKELTQLELKANFLGLSIV